MNRSTTKPLKIRAPARPYRIFSRRGSRFLAVRLANGKQRSSKTQDFVEARAFAYRWMANCYPRLAILAGVEVTPELKNQKPRA